MTSFIIFATTTEHSSGGIFGALGINFQVLAIQIIAFVILLLVLKKFVYPGLIKSVDAYHENIENASKAAMEAKMSVEETQQKVTEMLKEAQISASGIVSTAKKEAAILISDSEEKAKKRSEQIVANAQDEIKKEIIAARKTLYSETLELVALATEKVIGKVMTSESDSQLINEAIKDVK